MVSGALLQRLALILALALAAVVLRALGGSEALRPSGSRESSILAVSGRPPVFPVTGTEGSDDGEARRASGDRTLRRRFVLGVPWGTLVSALFVACVYLFLQGGLTRWRAPLVLPFRAWSYFYPLGMATAAFAHAGPAHLIGNLVGTLTLAPLVEYAWGHFPRRRGSSSFGSFRTNPLARAFVLFPAAVLGVGLATAVFAVGPIVGFSGVVFAFAGFALVYYPVWTVVALTAGRAVDLVFNALAEPTITAAGRSTYVTPWFANIAVQGHAVGLLFGLLLGLALADRRGDSPPSALRLWVGTFLFAVAEGLWAVYWYLSGDTFVLFRAVGAALVVALATLVAAAVRGSDRTLRDRGRVAGGRLRRAVGGVSVKRVALGTLVLAAAALSGVAVPVNLFAVSEGGFANQSVEARDYRVTYAEGVQSGMVPAVDVAGLERATNVTTSGVIVRNPDRGIWTTAVTTGRLASAGRATVPVGGVGWRETVVADRDGWNVIGGGTAYRVGVGTDGRIVPVYVSEPATATAVVAGWNVSVAPAPDEFYVVLSDGGERRRAPLPAPNGSVSVGGVTFVRDGSALFAEIRETRVPVAAEETYD